MVFQVKKAKQLENKAINIFGITSDPIECGFITTNGSCLKFPSIDGNSHSVDRGHFRIRRIDPEIQTSNHYINETANIRTQITPIQASFEIRRMPTQEQLNAIKSATVDKKIFIDYTDSKANTIHSGQFKDFREAKKWMDENVKNTQNKAEKEIWK
jgi:hypothetical protein